MADIKQIQFKRSNVAGKRPLPADVAEGELAINIKDATLFTKNADGTIIDLGFAKGGKVDGNINQVSGSFTTVGDIKTTGGNVISETGEVRSNAGVLRTKAVASSNSHVWFDGAEVTGTNRNSGRAVIYANPQTTSSGGAITYQVYDKSNTEANGANGAFFHMYGTGDFDASRDINATRDLNGQRAKLMVSVQTPQVITNNINTDASPFQTYGWEDLRTYSVGNDTIPLNYVYKGRAHQGGTIWHQLLDESAGLSEWALYSGTGPEYKQFAIANGDVNGGQVLTTHSLGIGVYSTLGKNSIALGDNDTGLRGLSDGAFSLIANSQPIIELNAYKGIPISIRKKVEILNTDASNSSILPPHNTALLEINTSADSNNTASNGISLLGYNSSGKYYHYFRGKGYTSIDTLEGLQVTNGPLTTSQGINAYGKIYANADIVMPNDTAIDWRRNSDFARISFKNDSDQDADSYMKFNAGDNGNEHFKFFSTSGTTETLWATIKSGQVIPENYSNFDERFVKKSGDTMTGDLAVPVLNATGRSIYILGSGNKHLWFGTSEDNDNNKGLVYADDYGTLRIRSGNSGSTGTIGLITRSVEIDGTKWAALCPHGYAAQYNTQAPLHVNFGQVSGTSDYYPIVRGRSIADGYGYATQVELGMLRSGGDKWGEGNLIVTNSERGDGPMAIYRFAINGVMTVPDTIIVPKLAVGTSSNVFGNGSIVIGDNDTGLVDGGDGRVNMFSNNVHIASFGVGNLNQPGLWASTFGLWTEGGHAIVSYGHLVQASDSYSTYVRDVYVRSDIRVKKDLREFENPSATLKKMPGRLYLQKYGTNEDGTERWQKSAGLIAQEVKAELPELVYGDEESEDGLLRLNYNGIVALNTAAINEHTDEIAELKAQVKELKEMLEFLTK
jgi:hypothetical protein